MFSLLKGAVATVFTSTNTPAPIHHHEGLVWSNHERPTYVHIVNSMLSGQLLEISQAHLLDRYEVLATPSPFIASKIGAGCPQPHTYKAIRTRRIRLK
jgi:hypothetical protein